MGYTTSFSGEWKISPPASPEQVAYLQAFNDTRRMGRDISKLPPDPLAEAVGLGYGEYGAYYVGGEEAGWKDTSILDYNVPPGHPNTGDFAKDWELRDKLRTDGKIQPGLWCGWTVTDDGTAVVWDETEKFYYYVEWIRYLIDHFFKSWGLKLNGQVTWSGEEFGDIGLIEISDNAVVVKQGNIVYG